MSAIPISQLPEINVTDPEALLVIVTSGVTYKIPFSALTATIFQNVDEPYIPVLSSNTTFVSSNIFQTPLNNVRVKELAPTDLGAEELFGVHAGETDSIVSISSTGSVDFGFGLTHQNTSSGQSASSDLVIIGDTGDYDQGYIDMGVNSSTYTGYTGVFALGGPSDAYVFSTANDLYIGNAIENKKLILFNGGFNTNESSVLYVHEDKSITINTPLVDSQNPAALRVVNANSGSTSMIHCDSNIDSFAAITSANVSSGQSASAVISATNDTNEINPDEGFIEMGINGSNYNLAANVGSAGDGFMFSTGNDLYIGNATPEKKLILFNGGFDAYTNAKMFIHPDGSITINTPDVDPSNPAALRIINANSGSTSMILAQSDINDYAEISSVNTSDGDMATARITAKNDIGYTDPTAGFVSMGINSSSYSVPDTLGSVNDAYFYSTGNDLFIGNTTPNKKIVFFNGGIDAYNNAKIYIHPNGTVAINTDTNDLVNPAGLRVFAQNSDTFNIAYFVGQSDNYTQINTQNTSNGFNASGDYVVTANNGDEESFYIDMGINSDNYNVIGQVGGPNDAYLYSTGNHLHIGNASSGDSANIYFFVGGPDTTLTTKLTILNDGNVGVNTITPGYQLDISGDTRIQDGNFIITSGQTNLGIVVEAQDNSDAILSGLTIGDVYRTGDLLKIVH